MKERSEDDIRGDERRKDIAPGDVLDKFDALATALSDVASRVGSASATDALLRYASPEPTWPGLLCFRNRVYPGLR
ncbi:hypothetical protein [Rhodococcus sp. 24CO]|uniref:hypothetical protein n=1 Tax=Rhodococcus sp. 24CO TaxID=3117460 RepID=UPI003D355554